MAVERINTFAVQQMLVNGSGRTLSNLVDLQRQLSSGYKASSFAELGGGESQILSSLTTKMQRTDSYTSNNALIVSRLQNSNQALTNIIDIATSISNTIAQRRNGAIADSIPFVQQMTDYQKSISVALSANIEGRYLFSGSATNTPPIKDAIPTPAQLGTPDNSYYQGSDQDITIMVQDDHSVTYNVRADNPAFQKLYAGIAQALHGDGINNQADLASAYSLIQQGLQGVVTAQAQVNTNIVNIQNVNTQLQSFQTYWKNTADNIDKTDIIGVSTQIALNESTLTASYQAYSRITGLRLSDYLR